MLTKEQANGILSIAFANNEPVTKEQPKLLTGGILNQVIEIQTNKGSFVAKIFRQDKLDPSAVLNRQQIFRLMRDLYQAGFPIPEPISIQKFQGQDLILMQKINGTNPEVSAETAKKIGCLLATFHNKNLSLQEMPDFAKPNGIIQDLQVLGIEIGSTLWRACNPLKTYQELKYLGKLLWYAAGTLTLPDKSKLPAGVVHHDPHPGNFVQDATGNLFMLDLELCQGGYYVDDLALAIITNCFNENKFQYHLMLEIVRAYNAIRPLSKEEFRYLINTSLQDRGRLELISQSKLECLNMPYGTKFNLEQYQDLDNWVKTNSNQNKLKDLFKKIQPNYNPLFRNPSVNFRLDTFNKHSETLKALCRTGITPLTEPQATSQRQTRMGFNN